jgi:hypothetical protein
VMIIALLIIVYNGGDAMRCCALLSMLNFELEGRRGSFISLLHLESLVFKM